MLMQASNKFEVFRRDMLNICVQVLPRMYLRDRQMFCIKAPLVSGSLKPEDASMRDTLITLLGLMRLAEEGIEILDFQELLSSIIDRGDSIRNGGDMSLLLWACTLIDPEQTHRLTRSPGFAERMLECPDLKGCFTMENAWLLSAIAHIVITFGGLPRKLKPLAVHARTVLQANYGGKGIFGHQSGNTIGAKLGGRVGSFVDQVYPMYALAKFGQACGDAPAVQMALECAEAVTASQGKLGQWWWKFDRKWGKRIGRYPVYSVHQYGMAPMALSAVTAATARAFSDAVHKGFGWLTGRNELGMSLIDRQIGTIWRCMYRGGFGPRLEEIANLAGLPLELPGKRLKVLRESRPYCFGWLLYALAGESDFRLVGTKREAL